MDLACLAAFIAESPRQRRQDVVPEMSGVTCRTCFCGQKGLLPKGLEDGHLWRAYPFLRGGASV